MENKIKKVLQELYYAGVTVGENQWSGDMNTLITVDQAFDKIEDITNDPIQIRAEVEEREYRRGL